MIWLQLLQTGPLDFLTAGIIVKVLEAQNGGGGRRGLNQHQNYSRNDNGRKNREYGKSNGLTAKRYLVRSSPQILKALN
jgi:hypothetical protein